VSWEPGGNQNGDDLLNYKTCLYIVEVDFSAVNSIPIHSVPSLLVLSVVIGTGRTGAYCTKREWVSFHMSVRGLMTIIGMARLSTAPAGSSV
jgi:hypothetical protein